MVDTMTFMIIGRGSVTGPPVRATIPSAPGRDQLGIGDEPGRRKRRPRNMRRSAAALLTMSVVTVTTPPYPPPAAPPAVPSALTSAAAPAAAKPLPERPNGPTSHPHKVRWVSAKPIKHGRYL